LIDLTVRPRGPYSLAFSGAGSSDATRVFRDGVLSSLLRVEGRLELTRAWQLPDGSVRLAGPSEAGLERLRFLLALDDDHSEFLRRFHDDPLLGRSVREFRGLRPLRVATVAQSLLRALCGQLIESRRAWHLERRIVRATTEGSEGLHAAPTAADFASVGPADLRRLGLHARRGATLVRICSSLDLERLRDLSTDAVAARLARERGLGPWSVGLICMEGLGRWELGMVGDLGLIKLASDLRGRRAEAEDTAELLAPYGEWAGLAGLYLLKGYGRGLVPLPARTRAA